VVLSVDRDHPERVLEAVVEAVGGFEGVDDPAAVGRDLRLVGGAPVEEGLRGEDEGEQREDHRRNDLGRVNWEKPRTLSATPRPESLTPVQAREGAR
jgi:hypothetical protein